LDSAIWKGSAKATCVSSSDLPEPRSAVCREYYCWLKWQRSAP